MQAQTATAPAVGEYYLQGVMETASGFKLNDDGTFDFFFSYGALDREGKGRWKQKGDTIIFDNDAKRGSEFTLVQSKKQTGEGITIQVSGIDDQFKRMVHAFCIVAGKEEHFEANAKGLLSLPAAADSIRLLFELCPEKTFVFAVPDKTKNYFEFTLSPSIMEVLFDDFTLQLTTDGFTGPHPMDLVKTFTYKKAKQHEAGE